MRNEPMTSDRKHTLSCYVALLLGSLIVAPVLAAPTGAWQRAGTLSEPRTGAASALLADGRALISGGSGPGGPLVSAEIYANGTFSPVAPMTFARTAHSAVALRDGRVLVVGGKTSDGQPTWSAEIYDPARDQWVTVGEMAKPRTGHTASLLPDGRVVIAGGQSIAGATDTIEVFDPASRTFTAASGIMSAPRMEHAATVLEDGRVLIAGGSDGNTALVSVDIFDPATGQVSPTDELSTPRAGLTATTLLSGIVLIVGGSTGKEELASAELYNPESHTFTSAKGGLARARRDHLAFLLPDNNNVLIAGGTAAGNPIESAELFKPSLGNTGALRRFVSRLAFWTSSFSPTSSLLQPRLGATGIALSDGRLLVAGGSGSDSAELYEFPTLKTDREIYGSAEVAAVIGSNWQPGEMVTIRLSEDPKNHDDRTIKIAADETGSIRSTVQLESHDVPVRIYVAAMGNGSQAHNKFSATTSSATPPAGPITAPSVLSAGPATGHNASASRSDPGSTSTQTVGALSVTGLSTVTVGAGGIFPSNTIFAGVPLNGLQSGYGVEIDSSGAALGQFSTVLLGVTLGSERTIIITGQASAGARSATNVATFSGTCSVNMGDGTPPLLSVPFTAAISTDANDQGTIGLVIGATTLPDALVTAGSMTIE